MIAICLGILHTHITAAHGALNSGSSVGRDHLDAKSSSLYHHFSVFPRTAEHQVCSVFDTSPATVRLGMTTQPPTDEGRSHVRPGVGDVKRLSAASEHASDLGELDLCLSEHISIPNHHSVLPTDKHPSPATDRVVTTVLPADPSVHVNQSIALEEIHLDNRYAESDFFPPHPIRESRRRGSMDANVLCVTDHSGSSDWSTLIEQDDAVISPKLTAGRTLSRQAEFLTSHSLGHTPHENGSSRQLINSRGNDADLKENDSDLRVIQPTADLSEINDTQQIQLANARDDGYVSALSQPLAHDKFSSVTALPHYHSLFGNLVTDSSLPKSLFINSVNSSTSVVLPTCPSIDQNVVLTTQVCEQQPSLLDTCVSVAGKVASQLDSSSSSVCELDKSIATNASNMGCPQPETEQQPSQPITPPTCQSLRKRCWSVSIPINLTLGNVPSGFYPHATLSALNCLMPSPNAEHTRFCLSLISMRGSAKSNSMARFIPPCLRNFLPGAFDFAISDRIATPRLRPSPSVAGECLKRPSACWFHSSTMALSSGASSVSDVSRSENSAPAGAVRPARLLNLESVHDIGVGLGANPNSLVLPSPSEQKSFDSLVKLPTDSAFSMDDPSVIPTHGYNSCPSSSHVSFTASPDATQIVAERPLIEADRSSPAGLMTIGPITECTVNDDESNRQSPPFPETNEDTITAHSRRRAKFLQLFLQRASLNQPRCTHLASQPSLGPTRGSIMEHWTKPDQLSQSINLLNMTSASWRLSEAHHSSSSFEARYLSETGAEPAGRESMRRLDVGTHSGSVDRRRTFAQDELLSNVKLANVRTIKKIHYLPRNYYSASGSKPRQAFFRNKGQTPSETEYDRINSDVGSEVDSSSGPEEIPIPTVIPNSPGTTKLNNWLTEVHDLAVRSGSLSVRPAAPNMTKEADQFGKRPSATKVRVSGRRPHGLSKRKHSLRPAKSLFTNRSSEGSTESRDTADAWMEQEQSSDSAQSDKHPVQPDVSLSNAEEMSKLAHNADSMSNGLWPETIEDHLFQSPQSPFPVHRRAPSEKHNYPPQVSGSFPAQWTPRPSSSMTDTVRCYVWEGDKLSKFSLTMLDIGCNVIRTVERQGISTDYVTLACVITVILPVLSAIFHLSSTRSSNQVGRLFVSNSNQSLFGSLFFPGTDPTSHGLVPTLNGPFADTLLAMHLRVLYVLVEKMLTFFGQPLRWLSVFLCANETSVLDHSTIWSAFTNLTTGRWLLNWLQAPDSQGRLVMLLGIPLRFNVYGAIFFLLCIAERTFQQRLLYAKYFFSLTSARRARKYRVPHFRLNKLRHIKCWLTLRSYLKKRGPQRSVEAIIAAAFYIVFVFGLALCSQLLSRKEESVFGELINWDILWLTLGIMLFLHRLIIVGTKITKKYRNFSILITEQINLYLSMEKKPHKKDELMSTFQVLRLAEGLLKEVDGPFRVCGWTVNPLVYNIFKLVLLSCFSSLLSETLGFKLKLYKLKLNAANW
ncbi:hypothetical protein EG68_05477 [Paragonimus skrjabini miyazakii]|uniref:Homeodomain transcription factor n=1 Tax=Paragonimus skrjabini miyazakii TaxID=59628 RepID=A0A8S9YE39_9TREM|nr:hypothetical protein EG68_05477 [Paragonimus skrjabini miyazakii]